MLDDDVMRWVLLYLLSLFNLLGLFDVDVDNKDTWLILDVVIGCVGMILLRYLIIYGLVNFLFLF